MSGPYKRFPPGRGNLLIPTTSKAASRAALAMYSPSRWRGFLIQRAALFTVTLFGPRALPGRTTAATPLPSSEWRDLLEAWAEELGEFDAFAVHRPPDDFRQQLGVLLIRRGKPHSFVKVRATAEAAPLETERTALQLLSSHRSGPFMVTGVRARGSVGRWAYLALFPLPAGVHRPVRSPHLNDVLESISRGLRGLMRPEGVPDHWTPMHGDFTPWNLRHVGDALFLLDWESAGWGPPGSDEVMYRSTAAAMGLGSRVDLKRAVADNPEAAEHWKSHWNIKLEQARSIGLPIDRTLAMRMTGLLEAHR